VVPPDPVVHSQVTSVPTCCPQRPNPPPAHPRAEWKMVPQQKIMVGKRDNSKKKDGFQKGLGRWRR